MATNKRKTRNSLTFKEWEKVDTMNKILIIDDENDILDIFKQLLIPKGYEVITVDNAEEGFELTIKHKPDLIFLDNLLPGKSGLKLLSDLQDHDPNLPVIIMTGTGTMRTAVEAVKSGAFDYILKPFDTARIISLVNEAMALKDLNLSFEISDDKPIDLITPDELIGKSEPMLRVFRQIGEATKTSKSMPILILGEGGTGKNLVARAIHEFSDNPNESFEKINCATISESDLEIEMLGTRLDHSDESSSVKGKFESASDGTIYFDKIDEMSLSNQRILLNAIEERRYLKNSYSTAFPLNARIITASRKDLTSKIMRNSFREDLYFKLKAFTILMPPLRERKEDIPLLVSNFTKVASGRYKKRVRGISEEYLEKLLVYNYPGNVSELEYIVEQSVLRSHSRHLKPEDLPPSFNYTDSENGYPGNTRLISHLSAQERRLTAILFTDINEYSKMMEEDEERTLKLLDEHNKIVDESVEKNNGVRVKRIGDSVMAVFASAVHAVQSAIEIQRTLERRNMDLDESKKWFMRIGIHLGDVVINGDDAFGNGVNIASRIESLAEPGGICISQDIYNQVHNQMDINIENMGPKLLKNISSEINMYKVNVNSSAKLDSAIANLLLKNKRE